MFEPVIRNGAKSERSKLEFSTIVGANDTEFSSRRDDEDQVEQVQIDEEEEEQEEETEEEVLPVAVDASSTEVI